MTHESGDLGPVNAFIETTKNGLVEGAKKTVPTLDDVCTAMQCAYVSVDIYCTFDRCQYALLMSA